MMGQLGCSPLFLIKTHLQAEAAAAIAVGHQHHHRGMVHALRTIYRKEGVSNFKYLVDLILLFQQIKF